MSEQIENNNVNTTNVTEDGKVSKQILKEGTGELPTQGYNVKVTYIGTLLDGTEFDKNVSIDEPFEFILGQNKVIKGWELGVSSMKKGEKSLFTIASEYAYGDKSQPKIPTNSTLKFEIELLDYELKKKTKWEMDSKERFEEA